MTNNNQQYFSDLISRYRELMVRSRDAIGLIAVELFTESFQKQGKIMQGGTVVRWAKRGNGPPSRKNASLLIKSGGLMRSNRYRKQGSSTVIIYNAKPQASLLNDGGTVKVTAKMRRFFWAMYYKYAFRLVYNIADKGLKQTKSNIKRGGEAEFWFNLALSKELTIKARPFFYDTPELPRRLDKYFDKQVQRIIIR